MSSQAAKSSARNAKPTPQNQQPTTSRSSSLAAHLAMVELKQRIITSLSKLADRDTHQIALEDLHSITNTLSPETLPMLLNSLYDTLSDQSTAKPSVKKESLHLLGLVCQTHRELTLPHLTKVITHIVKRLKDSDSGVRDACRDAIGALSGLYLREGGGDGNAGGSMVGLFVRPLFEAMGEQNKVVQAGASTCMAKMVESAAAVDKDGGSGGAPVAAFQKLCSRICKLLNGQNFMAKAALLGVVASLSQVGAVAPQSLQPLLQSIQDCLSSTDWATRKAGAEALSALAVHSSSQVSGEAADSILTALEACRFDKIKPVRDSMNEALQLWKKIAGKGGDGVLDDQKASSPGGENQEKAEPQDKNLNVTDRRVESSTRGSPNGSSPTTDSAVEAKARSIPDKAVIILKKKAPALTDKEVNPEFFHKLETRASGDVEVVVSRRCVNTSSLNNEEEPESNNTESKARPDHTADSKSDELYINNRYRINDRGIMGRDSRSRTFDDEQRIDFSSRETAAANRAGLSKTEGPSEGSLANSKGNWLAIQRQLLQLERQQTNLMHMLQDFMGGSHDSMVTLENRVRGLERVVEDMARDLSMSSSRRGGGFSLAFEGTSSNRSFGKYNGFSDYSSPNYSGRVPFGDRFAQSDVNASAARGRNPHWRGDASDAQDFPSYGSSRNAHAGSRRAAGGGSVGSPKSEHENDQVGSRRGWDKGGGPSRLGEGPSARSVWQASKDEATLEAIRVAGEEKEVSRTARVAIPEMTAEAMGDGNVEQERDAVWTSWMNAMDALKVGDMDTAYAEVTSTGDDQLLVKIMDRTGPVVDQLTNETACDVLHAIAQFLLDHNLFDISFSWIHQLVDVVMENGPDVMGIPMELKRELLLNLHEASTTFDLPEDWEGVDPEQLLLQLASAWRIELQQFEK
ncbi:Microtubule-associated protein TORTIFOLIA1 [Linum perenne]